MKQIIITQEEKEIKLNVDKGVNWSTFLTGIEMMLEIIKENAIDFSIDDILEDIKRIYLRDKED